MKDTIMVTSKKNSLLHWSKKRMP